MTAPPTFLQKAFGALGAVFGATVEIPSTYSPTKVYGSTGSRTYGGTPDNRETNRKLIGTQRYTTYDNAVANTDVIGVGVRLFLNLLAGATWDAVPAKPPASEATAGDAGDADEPTPEAQLMADRIRELVLEGTATTWQTIMKWLGGFLYYDFRIAEAIYGRRKNGFIGLADLSPRPNQTIEQWSVTPAGEVLGVVQRNPQTQEYVAIPRGKLVVLADGTISSAPEGLGILRHTIEAAARIARLLDLETIGYETTMEGMPIGRAPYIALKKLEASGTIPGFKAADATAGIEAMVQNKVVTRQRGLMLDSEPFKDNSGNPSSVKQFDLEVVRGEGKGAADIDNAIQREKRFLAMVLSIEHLILGGERGAMNLAEEKNARLIALINNALAEIAAALKRDVVTVVMRLNGWPIELTPDLVPADVTKIDATVIAAVLRDLAQAGDMLGAPTPDKAPDEVRRAMGLSPRPKADPMAAALTPAPPTDPNAPPAGPGKPGAKVEPPPAEAKGAPVPAAAARAIAKRDARG